MLFYEALGVYLPLVATTNCAVLGVALINVPEKLQHSGGRGLRTWRRRPDFFIAIVLMAGIRGKDGGQRYSGVLQGNAHRASDGLPDGHCIFRLFWAEIGRGRGNVRNHRCNLPLVGGTGLLLGLFLGISNQFFHVEVDEKKGGSAGSLPGNNCGGCALVGL